ncbi:MAG: hypothetical protein IJ523_12730 [Succinivibrionaceae bacterium]|nr:hypothetical protein [Succinivibrionaceae bacterium]
MKKEPIITEDFIDEEQAKAYLITAENDLELLPCIPSEPGLSDAAAALGVSEPTVQRMLQDGQIKLQKRAILDYIMQKMLVNRPVKLAEPSPKSPILPQIEP